MQKKLKVYLGPVYRDVQRKVATTPEEASGFHKLFKRIAQLLTQQRQDKSKQYSVHAPEGPCLAKGKAHWPYEAGASRAGHRRAPASVFRRSRVSEAWHASDADGGTAQSTPPVPQPCSQPLPLAVQCESTDHWAFEKRVVARTHRPEGHRQRGQRFVECRFVWRGAEPLHDSQGSKSFLAGRIDSWRPAWVALFRPVRSHGLHKDFFRKDTLP